MSITEEQYRSARKRMLTAEKSRKENAIYREDGDEDRTTNIRKARE